MKIIYKISRPLNFVFSYLTDMQQFALVHPVIKKIERVSLHEYLVYETLQLGFVPFSFTYPVSISQNNADKSVKMKAIVFKLATIEIDFKLRTQNELTVVEETIHFKSILPIKYLMENIFRKQHSRLFKNIQNSKYNNE